MISQGAPALDGSLRVLAADPLALDEATAILLKFSLIQYRADATILSIHRVVQDILIEELTVKQQRQWAIRVVRLVNCVFPETNFNNWSACERYLLQAQRGAELITNFHLMQKDAAHLLQRLGNYCYHRARYQDAEKYLAHALRICEKGLGPEHPDTAQTLNSLGLLYY